MKSSAWSTVSGWKPFMTRFQWWFWMGKINVCKIYVDLLKISSCRDAETAFNSIMTHCVWHNFTKADISWSYFTFQKNYKCFYLYKLFYIYLSKLFIFNNLFNIYLWCNRILMIIRHNSPDSHHHNSKLIIIKIIIIIITVMWVKHNLKSLILITIMWGKNYIWN